MRIFIFIGFIVLNTLVGQAQTWFEYYRQGIDYAQADSLEKAKVLFEKTLKIQPHDRSQARIYGVNFIEYFPNREIGILLYRQQQYDQAIEYLEKSVAYEPSKRAEDYLLMIGQVKHDRNLSVIDEEPPEIHIFSPGMLSMKVFNPVPNNVKTVSIMGKAEDPGGVIAVIVNDSEAILSANGEFKAEIPLNVGQNEIFINATDKRKNSVTRSYLLYRADTIVSEIGALAESGKYYALVIGISNYSDPEMTDLDGYPLEDAENLVNILTERYTFEKSDIIHLKDPTRREILGAFDNLNRTVTEKDNLLIFYAGHGYYDEETELGYWLPADAEKDFTANWIYNDVLVANVKRIKAIHTLLISDACFSGSIFKTRALEEDAPAAYQKKYELKSRKAITSGVLKTVPNKSIFFKYLAERLSTNQEKYLSGSQLFQDIEIPVANNSPSTPQYGVIRDVGDEGGDFIFILREGK